MFRGKRIDHLPADDFREIDQLRLVTAAERTAVHLMRPRRIWKKTAEALGEGDFDGSLKNDQNFISLRTRCMVRKPNIIFIPSD